MEMKMKITENTRREIGKNACFYQSVDVFFFGDKNRQFIEADGVEKMAMDVQWGCIIKTIIGKDLPNEIFQILLIDGFLEENFFLCFYDEVLIFFRSDLNWLSGDLLWGFEAWSGFLEIGFFNQTEKRIY